MTSTDVINEKCIFSTTRQRLLAYLSISAILDYKRVIIADIIIADIRNELQISPQKIRNKSLSKR